MGCVSLEKCVHVMGREGRQRAMNVRNAATWRQF